MNPLYKALLLLIGIAFLVPLTAQQNTFSTSSDSDPEAKKLLNEVASKIDEMGNLKLTFSIDFTDPIGQKESHHGELISDGNKYRFELSDQLIVCDGKYSWVYMKNRNEVMINDFDEDEVTMLSPTFFLDFHNSGDYSYAITNEYKDSKGNMIKRVDFKPISKFSEFKKVGIDIDVSKKLPKRLLVLSNDGSRILFQDLKVNGDYKTNVSDFRFDVTKYQGIHIEDLRLD